MAFPMVLGPLGGDFVRRRAFLYFPFSPVILERPMENLIVLLPLAENDVFAGIPL